MITHIGGHFVSNEDDEGKTIFGAIVPLLGSSSFPVLSRDDFSSALGATKVVLPGRSADVFGELALRLDPGWYAVVFGSGLFGADSYGGSALRTNRDVGVPNRITSQPGYGWLNMSDVLPSFINYRFVVQGVAIPEPSTSILLALVACACFVFRRGVVLA
jgi:hypothetical protein